MGKKSRRNRTKPAQQCHPYYRLAKLFEEAKHKEIREEESEWLFMATELENESRAAGHIGKEKSLSAVLNIHNILAASYRKDDIESTLKYHEKSWTLVEESLSLGVILDRNITYRRCGKKLRCHTFCSAKIELVGTIRSCPEMHHKGDTVTPRNDIAR